MEERVNALVGLLGMFLGVLLIPPLFARLFAMSVLIPEEKQFLLFSGIALIALSSVCLLFRNKISANLSLFLLSILLLVCIELGVRAYIVTFQKDSQPKLAQLAERTYSQLNPYQGNAFLQFTGRPPTDLYGNPYFSDLTPFNNFGFPGKDLVYAKPSGILRIAALGGSTTEDGYPLLLENYLNSKNRSGAISFESMNFGLGWYTTAHSLVNFVLNVVNFSPDFVIIHHAWNDEIARDKGSAFRSDYSHILKSWEFPTILDRPLIRLSVIYRYTKQLLTKGPGWVPLGEATSKDVKFADRPRFEDLKELQIYERNIRAIIDYAKVNNIRAILTSQPHSSDPNILWFQYAKHITQCNTIIRSIAEDYGSSIIFVDLDIMMTGRMDDVFVDVAHLNDAGRQFKAEQIGNAILKDLEKQAW